MEKVHDKHELEQGRQQLSEHLGRDEINAIKFALQIVPAVRGAYHQ